MRVFLCMGRLFIAALPTNKPQQLASQFLQPKGGVSYHFGHNTHFHLCPTHTNVSPLLVILLFCLNFRTKLTEHV